jgi:hypothetical protein
MLATSTRHKREEKTKKPRRKGNTKKIKAKK